MKNIIIYAATIAVVIVMIFGITYAVRMFSNATTPLTLHTPKQGVTCAAMVTGDGAALSCWKD